MIALLDPRFLIAGVGIHKHVIYGNVVVVELAHDVDENESSMISCSNGTQSEIENKAELLLRAARSTRMKDRIQKVQALYLLQMISLFHYDIFHLNNSKQEIKELISKSKKNQINSNSKTNRKKKG